MGAMTLAPRDVAQIRLDNALLLFDEFVHATIKYPDAATLRGLEGRFAERLQIQPSYWSQIKGRSRQIGERLARQFEQLCRKPLGWMDEPHGPAAAAGTGRSAPAGQAGRTIAGASSAAPAGQAPGRAAPHSQAEAPHNLPQDDDERFIVGLVLTYYRRHPQRARSRLLDLLGEVLTPSAAAAPKASAAKGAAPPDDGRELWNQTQAAVKPLKPKR